MSIFGDAWQWLEDNLGSGLDLQPYKWSATEGDDAWRFNLDEQDLYTWNDIDMKGGNDLLTVQFSDAWRSTINPGTLDGGAGTDTFRLWVDDGRGLNFDFALTATGPIHTAVVKVQNFEKFDILSSSQDDRIRTGNYDDRVTSGAGNDWIETFNGADQISAGAGDDTVAAGYGDDTVYGNEGNDTIYASPGTATGGSWGDDQIFGGAGNDTIYDRDGRDLIYGGRGNDHIIVDGHRGDFFSGGLADFEMKANTISNPYARAYNMDFLSVDTLNVTLETKSNQSIQQGWLFDATTGNARDLRPGETASFRFESFEILNVNGTGQNDKIILGAGADTANGGAGIDVLFGMNGADILRGNEGADSLYGGLGADILVGGAGADTFMFNTALGAGEVDRIYDFEVPADTILLNNAIFRSLADGGLAAGAFVTGTRALQADDRIIYNKTTGDIAYDADGSGAGAAVLFAKVNAGLALTSADFIIV
jgi:serralysin